MNYATTHELHHTPWATPHPKSYASHLRATPHPRKQLDNLVHVNGYLVSVQNMTETYLKISSKMCRGRVSNPVNKNISLSILSEGLPAEIWWRNCEHIGRGLTRAIYILCIEHLRMFRLNRESNPGPPALQANTLCIEPFERRIICHSESQLVLLQVTENQGKDDITPEKPRQSARENKRRWWEWTGKTESVYDEDKWLATVPYNDDQRQKETQTPKGRVASTRLLGVRTCYNNSPSIPG